MDIVVKGRHQEVGESFREHATEKLSRVERLDHKVIRIDVEVCKENNPRQSSHKERVELTCVSKGPVIRAEAAAEDPYSALDRALTKLEERLRRAADRRRVHHGNRTPLSLAAATGAPTAEEAAAGGASTGGRPGSGRTGGEGDGVPVEEAGPDYDPAPDLSVVGPGLVVREKVHDTAPMTIDQALFEMELVGHDFFLFADAGCGLPSVVYRRRGYDYGVIRLAVQEEGAAPVAGEADRDDESAAARARAAGSSLG